MAGFAEIMFAMVVAAGRNPHAATTADCRSATVAVVVGVVTELQPTSDRPRKPATVRAIIFFIYLLTFLGGSVFNACLTVVCSVHALITAIRIAEAIATYPDLGSSKNLTQST
jgi:hypothetical protein